MAHYSVWVKSRSTPRVAWVCGPEAVLRCDVVDAYRAAYPALRPVSLGSLEAEGDVWDLLFTLPQQPRLIIVWGAERLGRRDGIRHLLDAEFEGALTVFVSAEADFQTTANGKTLMPYLAALRDSKNGLLVRCGTPRDPEAQAQLVASWWPGAGRNIGAAVLERCGGDITEARHAARKAVSAGLAPDAPSVAAVCPPGNSYDFADLLVACEHKKAMSAAAGIRPEEAGGTLALVSSRLGVLALLGDASRKGENVPEFARRQRIDPFLVRLLRQHCAVYTPQKVAHCRQLLAMAEHSWKAGARDGVLEAVVALW